MNRVDRLMNIMLSIQSKKYVTADFLAEKFNLSVRTIYRDLKALSEIGIPIYFEKDKGYTLVQGYFLPPLHFTTEEANALILLQSLANKFTDKTIIKNSESALKKIQAVLKYQDWEKTASFSSKVEVYSPYRKDSDNLSKIQNAITDKLIISITYSDAKGNTTERKIEPIGIIFYTEQWHVIAWCWLRENYRDFKVDKILSLRVINQHFKKEHTYTIQDYMKIF
ncbi:helix-turn-helix transcriptional regulator [Tenacibaculum sp.]|uniref:helix-turn-helix transcriptional regulator n=1 Tax=Tenacibaculum sp. TaxID=1906242 RepID=UPI003D102E16